MNNISPQFSSSHGRHAFPQRSIRDNDGFRHNQILLIESAVSKRSGHLLSAERRQLRALGVSQDEINALSRNKIGLYGGGGVFSSLTEVMAAPETRVLAEKLADFNAFLDRTVFSPAAEHVSSYLRETSEELSRAEEMVINSPNLSEEQKNILLSELRSARQKTDNALNDDQINGNYYEQDRINNRREEHKETIRQVANAARELQQFLQGRR